MSTVTWRRIPSGYQVFFNRDELRAREAALPPAPAELNGVRYLAPRESADGGTWLAVNERGLTLGLLDNSEAAMRLELELAQRFGTGFHIHMGTSGEEDRFCREHFGRNAIPQLETVPMAFQRMLSKVRMAPLGSPVVPPV